MTHYVTQFKKSTQISSMEARQTCFARSARVGGSESSQAPKTSKSRPFCTSCCCNRNCAAVSLRLPERGRLIADAPLLRSVFGLGFEPKETCSPEAVRSSAVLEARRYLRDRRFSSRSVGVTGPSATCLLWERDSLVSPSLVRHRNGYTSTLKNDAVEARP